MFFGTPIVGPDIEGKFPQEQHNAYTSGAAIQLGKMIGSIPGIGRTDMASPARIDHVIKNATGTWGRDALRLIDMAARERPATTAETAVVSSGFVKNPDSGERETSKFFDLMAKGGDWYAGREHLKDMIADGDMKAAGRAMQYARDEGGKVYAVADRMEDLDIAVTGRKKMKSTGYTALKRQHPIRRAEEAGKIFRKARKEIMGNEFEVDMSKRERQQFVDELSSLYNAFNANALIHSEVKGWRQRDPVSESEKWARLNEINPEASVLIWNKVQKKKITPEDDVAEKYRDLKKKTRRYIVMLERQK